MLHTLGNAYSFAVTDALVRSVALFFKEELIIWRNVGNRLYFCSSERRLGRFVTLCVHKERME